MTSGQKVALSLLLTIILFAGFVVLAFSGVFQLIETRFYQPSLVHGIEKDLSSISEAYTEYINQLTQNFQNIINSEYIKSVSNPTQTTQNIQGRSQLFSDIASKISGLSGYRVVDTNGKAIHYSTFDSDIFKQQSNAISYKNFDESNYPYEKLALDGIFFDKNQNQLIFSYPYINSYGTEQGRILFYVMVNDFNNFLVNKNILPINQPTILVETSKNGILGFIYGFPFANQDFFANAVLERWKQGLFGTNSILDTEVGNWIMISNNISSQFLVAKVEKESFFLFPESVKILLLVCIFISIYLIFFLLFNLKQDSMVKIKHKIKKFQLAFINQYLEKENTANWDSLKKEIDKRKNDLSLEVKKSLGLQSKKHRKEIDALLSRSWEDLISVLSTKVNKTASTTYTNNVNMDEIKSMFEQILSSGQIVLKQEVSPVSVAPKAKQLSEVDELAEVEELSEADELAEVEELSEADELTEVEELAEVDELAEVEDLSDADELAEVEELSEVDELTEVEELSEVDELTEVVELSEVDELAEVEELSEADELTEVEELSEADELADVEELAEVAKIDGFSEKLQFGDDSEQQTYAITDELENFEVFKPDFSFLDEPKTLESEDVSTIKISPNFFSFTNCSFSKVVEELSTLDNEKNSSTIEEYDGIFHIKSNIDTSNVKQDLSFKALVESVMK